MLADAKDEGLVRRRLLDVETIDAAILNREVHSFNATISHLFGDQRGCLSCFGYTSVMIKLLGQQQLVWNVRGQMHGVGFEKGVPGDIIDRCLGRMRSYVVLARAALAAEFPSFEGSNGI